VAPVIKLENVRKRYRRGDRQVLAVRVDQLEVARAEHLALVGRSGCGKTTLLNIVAGILTPDEGTVEVDGVIVNKLSQGARDRFRAERMGYVFQTFNLLQSFTALENVELAQVFAHGRRDGKKHAMELLDRVDLADRAHHFPRELSVGQQQRVAIARALVNDPQLLLADEPLGNLDRATGVGALELLRQMAREAGRTILMVTHDPDTARKMDRIATLELPVEEEQEVAS
jgi:putative ABC transport system ATP-binding protein